VAIWWAASADRATIRDVPEDVLADCVYLEGFRPQVASKKASMEPGDTVSLHFLGKELAAEGHWGRLRIPWSAVTHLECRGPVQPEWEPIGQPVIAPGPLFMHLGAAALSGLSHMIEDPPHWCYLAVGRTDGPEVIFLVKGYVVPELEQWLEDHSAGPGT